MDEPVFRFQLDARNAIIAELTHAGLDPGAVHLAVTRLEYFADSVLAFRDVHEQDSPDPMVREEFRGVSRDLGKALDTLTGLSEKALRVHTLAINAQRIAAATDLEGAGHIDAFFATYEATAEQGRTGDAPILRLARALREVTAIANDVCAIAGKGQPPKQINRLAADAVRIVLLAAGLKSEDGEKSTWAIVFSNFAEGVLGVRLDKVRQYFPHVEKSTAN